MRPKGKLLIIGGAEYKGEPGETMHTHVEPYEILRELLLSSENKRIEVITSGTSIPEVVKVAYTKAFHRMGYKDPGFIHIKDKIEASKKEYLNRVKRAGAVFFTGGDQFRLSTILLGTKIVDMIKDRYHHDKEFLVAGTSAGAMVLTEVMITSGGQRETLMVDDLQLAAGLGIVKNCVIDTHFIQRGRFGRLAHAVILNPDQLGIGLGDDTALVIKNGSDAECRGSGMVVIIDGKNIRQTNVFKVKTNGPLYVENLIVHLLVKGCRFSIEKRQLYYPTRKLKKKKS